MTMSDVLKTTSIEPSTLEDLKSIVALHLACMETLLTDLGKNFVNKYYSESLTSQSVIALSAHTGEYISGWAFGSPNPAALTKKLMNDPIWFIWQLVVVTISNPKALMSLVNNLLHPGDNDIPPGTIELTYIGVAKDHSRRGIGKLLLHSFCNSARQRGYTKVILSVEKDNKPAFALYSAEGFSVISEFSEGHFMRYRMVREL